MKHKQTLNHKRPMGCCHHPHWVGGMDTQVCTLPLAQLGEVPALP